MNINKITTGFASLSIVVLATLLITSLETLGKDVSIKVMFYNVENLFDTEDNPQKNDNDFLPEGSYRWTKQRYLKKIDNVARVIIDIGENTPPAFIGLCEIENESIANDIVQHPALRKYNLKYIVSESKDKRGSNVGIIYSPDYLTLFSKDAFTPLLSDNKTTRDILYTGMTTATNDTIDFFVCHFYSRSEGEKQTETYRKQIAKLLKQKSDSIKKTRQEAQIIIMGDFNDYPENASMSEVLNALIPNSKIQDNELYNLSIDKEKKVGSYKYKKDWGFFDQIIVTGKLINDGKVGKELNLFSKSYLLEKDKQYGGYKPYRTYKGYRYIGGISDHLPVYINIKPTK